MVNAEDPNSLLKKIPALVGTETELVCIWERKKVKENREGLKGTTIPNTTFGEKGQARVCRG